MRVKVFYKNHTVSFFNDVFSIEKKFTNDDTIMIKVMTRNYEYQVTNIKGSEIASIAILNV